MNTTHTGRYLATLEMSHLHFQAVIKTGEHTHESITAIVSPSPSGIYRVLKMVNEGRGTRVTRSAGETTTVYESTNEAWCIDALHNVFKDVLASCEWYSNSLLTLVFEQMASEEPHV